MGANNANGKIYISAEVIDNFKQLASEVKNGLSQAAKEAKLEIEVDDTVDLGAAVIQISAYGNIRKRHRQSQIHGIRRHKRLLRLYRRGHGI